MLFLVLRAYLLLILLDPQLPWGNFSELYNKVKRFPLAKRSAHEPTVEQICAAVDLACIWYWKQAQCLQRSAGTVCLLRAHGIPAQMIIGVQQIPLRSHAWVEVDGCVANDKPYVPEIYAVLDRC